MINWGAIARRFFRLESRDSRGPLAAIIGGYGGYLPLIAVLGLVASLLESLGIGLLIPLLTLLTAGPEPAGMPAPVHQVLAVVRSYPAGTQVSAIGIAVLSLVIVRGLVQTGNVTLMSWVNGRIGRDMRNALSSRILNVEYDFFLKHDGTRLVQIISTDSWLVSEAIYAMLSILPAVLGLFVFGAFLAWLDWRLFLLVLAGTGIIRGLLYLVEKRLKRLSFEVTESNQALGTRMYGLVAAMRVIRIFGQQEREQARFARMTERVRQAMFVSQRTAASIAPGVDVLTSVLFVIVILAGYRLGLTIPTIAAFLVMLSRSQPHARTISEGRIRIAAVRGSIDEVEWLLNQAERPRLAGRSEAVPASQPIRFQGVSYAYPDGNSAVRGASFVIRPGVATALIGRSGSGKTTLVNLLCKLIEPQAGQILVGNVPLAAVAGEAWRERIAIAGQDIELVEGTIAENIAYGHPAASQAAIAEAAKAAGAHRFIEELPRGYGTSVGQLGARLSGGQRQRIGLARALLREPDLLILDEATSAVDAITEQEFMQLLAEHRHFGTALVISHRQSTLAACQDGVVIDDGEILEAGPLHTLEYYRTMAGEAA